MACDEFSHVLSPMSTAAQELVSLLKHINPISSTGHETIIWQSQGLCLKKQNIPAPQYPPFLASTLQPKDNHLRLW